MGRSKKFLLVVLSVLLLLVAAGCGLGKDPAPSQGQAVTVTGMPEQKVLPELVAAYNQAGRKYRLQYQPDASQPVDCYLETQAAVQQLARQQKLAPLTVKDNPVPAAFRDGQHFWCGVFYDPVVFLVNHQFAREQGQEQLRDWYSLPHLKQARLALENLTDNASTKDFLAALASHMGQAECLQYFKTLQPLVGTYGKFPITSIRMVAGGDADLALTRSSFVAPYLESDFPAYVQVPEGGTPVTLYAFALAKASRHQEACADFLTWLLTDPTAQKATAAGRLLSAAAAGRR
jgi:iron(III) transport system substrate-binding protein